MKKILFSSLVVALSLQFFYFSNLPEVVVHNFDSSGMARAGLMKNDYILFSTLAVFGNSIICLLAGSLSRKLPDKFLSFPFKHYWFADERKETAFLKMGKWTELLGLLINIFLMSLFYLLFLANRLSPPQLHVPLFYSMLTLYLILLICWFAAFLIAFRPPRTEDN